jgi:hypothetical protein
MSNEWKTGTAAEVKPGDRIRTAAGEELLVSRIEAPFFGRPEMLAFIEDTPERWYKRPVPVDVELEIQS